MAIRGSSRAFCAVLLFTSALAAQATNRVVVNTTADDFGLDGAHCSLREALYTLNQKQNFGGCTIVSGSLFDSVSLPAGTFTTTIAPVQNNVFAGGALVLSQNVVVIGAGAGKTIIDGGNLDAVFRSRVSSGLIGIVDATVRNGLSGDFEGAGLDFRGEAQLLLQRVYFTQNHGYYTVYSLGATGVNLLEAAVGHNEGNGVELDTSSGSSTINVVNSTISDNASPSGASGLVIEANEGLTVTATISNSTIAFNTSSNDYAAGLIVAGDGVTVYMRNSIVADNIRGSRFLDDCETGGPTLISQGYNIIGHVGVCPFQGDTSHDIVGVDPQLAPLWDYGSGVPTRAVLPGSLAYNAGNPATPGSASPACEGIDARGVTRGNDGRCDIGAYEHHVDYIVDSLADSTDPTANDSLCTVFNPCTLRKAIQKANDASGFTTIQLPTGTIQLARAPNNGDNEDGALDIVTRNAVMLVGTGATTIDGGGLDTTFRSGFVSTSTALLGVTVRNGNSLGAGGGVRVDAGSLLLDHSRVTGNRAVAGNGMYVLPGATAEIDYSTIDHNRSNSSLQSLGGGILAGGAVRLLNSTVADNAVMQTGAGMYSTGDVSMSFTTIAGNTQPVGTGAAGLAGNGGFWHVSNSIIAGNAQVSGATRNESDCAVVLQLQGPTFIQDQTGCTLAGTTSDASGGQDARLSSLTFQGGATPTIGPESGSPVLGLMTDATQCVDIDGNQLFTDQRDMDRPLSAGARCTVGAFQNTSDVIFADELE
ncbi:MAG TPA: CSLREA domain-containing protein [Rudaea sp.]|nr:CSLREA domain-containing protein [Rudaea sp.]